MIETVLAADLVEDPAVYPRSQVSIVHVNNLTQALRAGAVFPALRADLKSRRLSDGFHRRRAALRVHGDDVEVQVEFIDFATETELFADAVRCNTTHGLGLQEIEKARAALRLGDEGLDDVQIATVLGVPKTKVRKLRLNVTEVRLGGGQIKLEPVKRPHIHFAGKQMTEPQSRAARSGPGTSYLLLINQIRDGMLHGLIDPSNTRLRDGLEELHSVLGVYLGEGNEEAS